MFFLNIFKMYRLRLLFIFTMHFYWPNIISCHRGLAKYCDQTSQVQNVALRFGLCVIHASNLILPKCYALRFFFEGMTCSASFFFKVWIEHVLPKVRVLVVSKTEWTVEFLKVISRGTLFVFLLLATFLFPELCKFNRRLSPPSTSNKCRMFWSWFSHRVLVWEMWRCHNLFFQVSIVLGLKVTFF